MQRVWIIGPCGAGKSTLARALGERTGLPVVHLDQEHWKPGWVATDNVELAEKLEPIVAGERWIIEGNYLKTAGPRLERANMVVLLDLPRRLYLWRVFKRVTLGFGRVRADMAAGCPEQIDWVFFRYAWRFHRDTRPALLTVMAGLRADQMAVHLRSRREVGVWLDGLKQPTP